MATSQGERLKALLDQLHITNRKLAAEIHIDPAMITRWIHNGFGTRRVLPNVQMIADFVSGMRLSSENCAWLCSRMHISEVRDPTAEEIMLWLAPEVEVFLPKRHTSGEPVTEERPRLIEGFHAVIEATRTPEQFPENGSAYTTTNGLLELLKKELMMAPCGSTVCLFISSEFMDCILDPSCLAVVRRYNQERSLHWQVLLQSGSNTGRIGRMVNVFLPLIVKGSLKLNVMHGIPAAVSAELKVIFPSRSVILVSEVMGGNHPTLSSITRDQNIVQGLRAAFDSSLKFSRPMITVYDDSFARNIINIFFSEYGMVGHLDVIKSGLNPMFFTPEKYGAVLKKMGHTGDQYRWRYEEFERFKNGMNTVMKNSSYREILCLPMLRRIAETGICRMPGMYFFSSGIWDMDADDCVSLLDGYVQYLRDYPEFQVILLDEEEPFMANSCWHIKNNRHIMAHSWDIDDPIMVYSEEMILIDEFQRHFEYLWDNNRRKHSKRSVIDELISLRDQCRDLFLKDEKRMETESETET